MNFETLMQQVSGTATEKTANDTSVQTSTKTATEAAQEALKASLQRVITQEKTASADSDPVEALIKEAQRLADDAKTAELMHIRMMGTAFADAASETWNRNTTQKMASAQPVENTYEKTAAEEQAMLQQAANKGYTDTMTKVAMEAGYNATMEKVATEQYQAGQNEALEQVREAAAREFFKGAQEVDILLSQMNR
jgi:hypothetical protein